MITSIQTIRPGLKARVINVHEVRVGDRLYVTRSGVDNDVRTVVEIIGMHRAPTVYRFDRGPDLDERELQRWPRGCRTAYGDGTVLLLDSDVEVGDLPDEFDLLSALEQWIELGGAIRVEHTSSQYDWSAQMLTAMHKDANLDVYRCYAIDPRSLLIDRLPDGRFDEDDPRPQVLLRPHLWLLGPIALPIIEEAVGAAPTGTWIKAQRSLMLAVRDIPYDLPLEVDTTMVSIRPAATP